LILIETALIEKGVISETEMSRVRDASERTGLSVIRMLPQLGLISEEQLCEAISLAMDIPAIKQDEFPKDIILPDAINGEWLRKEQILPLSVKTGKLEAAIADPTNKVALEGLSFASDMEVKPYVAKASEILEAIAQLNIDASADVIDQETSLSNEEINRLLDGSSDAPVIRLVNNIIAAAARRNASDVHIEPMAKHLTIRLRLDGRLTEIERPSKSVSDAVASRIKVMAGLDISETRLPQDGRIAYTHMGEDIDIRVSTSPVAYGESIVLRLLGRSKSPPQLSSIGLSDDLQKKFKKALANPNGIILVTGPTGSGKTTTLYAGLNHLRRPDVKILTVEDPVEILLDGVNQVQVQPDIGLDYAGALKAFLRQDPDILMVGEIRDRETADIALRAALTGHLVLSTLHTNDALGAFTRLSDIGIDNYLSSSTVIAAIAQRLLRMLCNECKITCEISAKEKESLNKHGLTVPSEIYRPQGCIHCADTGYNGRIPIMEFVEMDKELEQLVQNDKVHEYQLKNGQSLQAQALKLVSAGITSISEAERIAGQE